MKRAVFSTYPTPSSHSKHVTDKFTCAIRVGSIVFVGRGETEAKARKAATKARHG